jgi:hypothetical protein
MHGEAGGSSMGRRTEHSLARKDTLIALTERTAQALSERNSQGVTDREIMGMTRPFFKPQLKGRCRPLSSSLRPHA